MRPASRNKKINELSEIIATALEDRPDLKKMISTLLGSGQVPVPEKRLTMADRREIAKSMFSRLSLKEKLKS